MVGTPFDRTRFWIQFGMIGMVAAVILWYFSPGLPVLFGPKANAEEREAGMVLFQHKWESQDPLIGGSGLGPVFNASSCATCHMQGGTGGGGPTTQNVTVFEVHPTKNDPQVHTGSLHHFALDPSCQDTLDALHKVYPVVKDGQQVLTGCQFRPADFDPVMVQSINTPALFGDGWIDRIPVKAITHNLLSQSVKQSTQEITGDLSDNIPAGRVRYLANGKVGKFGWKAQFATLEEFIGAACANELGLGNPVMERAKPITKPDDAAPAALDRQKFRQMVAFVDTLPRPIEVLPDAADAKAMAIRGKQVFVSVGCATCHTPDLGGVRGVYSDFLLHHMQDPESRDSAYGPAAQVDVPLPINEPEPDEWKTPALWGVADSAPYFHDGGSPTLMEAIRRHHGDASKVSGAFTKLPTGDQEAVILFLQTLKAPPNAPPAIQPNINAQHMAKR